MHPLHDVLLGLLATPVADAVRTHAFADPIRDYLADFAAWYHSVDSVTPLPGWRLTPAADNQAGLFIASSEDARWLRLEMPGLPLVGIRAVGVEDIRCDLETLPLRLIGLFPVLGIRHAVLFVCVDTSDAESPESTLATRFISAASDFREQLLVVEPQWAAAVLVDQLRPLGVGLLESKTGESLEGFGALESSGDSWALKRSSAKLHSLLGTVVADPGIQAEKLRRALAEEPFPGTTLLCTTYLPPVTQPPSVVQRFYRGFGATDEGIKAILERLALERTQWLRHVKSFKRVDVFDRSQIEEYLEQPEYYQMRLTKKELLQQVELFVELLREPNYFVCLSPESIALTFSTRGPEVEIRSDRRNKATPRAGRIGGILLRDPAITESFEREFWSIYRTAPPEYRDKSHIAAWLREAASRYPGHDTVRAARRELFDVFLCHNTRDKDLVVNIAKRLKRRKVKVWFADWNLLPGRPWQRSLEAQIAVIASAAVFVGPSGLGPWSTMEVEAFLQEFVRRGSPVIPVLLPGVEEAPEVPIFLKGMHWVDFRKSRPDPIAELIRGIRGS